ncbi:MAG: hypothetical protein F4Y44_11005 [Chloroflexi bacterium]|nr:hypothetical protein [Chloroflexota bacterium]
MTTPSTYPDDNPQSPRHDAAECEEGLRRVLAYICEKRYRRWIAAAILFMSTFISIQAPFSVGSWLFFVASALASYFNLYSILPEPILLGLSLSVLTWLLPLIITIVIFVWLFRIYKAR